MNKSVFQSQLEDDECVAALREVVDARSTEAPIRMGKTAEAVRTDDLAKGIRSLQTGRVDLEMPSRAEAIVMRHNYPSLLILDGTYEEPENPHWKRVLDPHQPAIQRSIASVGRVDLTGHRDYTWVGTLWRIADDILITNRHVASIFAKAKRDGGYRIQKRLKVFADFKEEHRSTEQLEFLVKSIVSIEPTSSIDMALLRLDGGARDLPGEPVPLRPGRSADEYLAVVGYPAWDHRNDAGDMARIFRDIFNVKRLAPGKVMNENHSADVFTHNCTTLGGNSGSLVLDIESGGAVGLHFAGSALSQNYAVKAEAIEEAMRRNSVTGYRIVDGSRTDGDGDSGDGADGDGDERRRRENFDDRDGYQPDFLGGGRLSVPLPRLNMIQSHKVAKTADGESVLKYRHFSTVVNKERQLAFYSAANIDGDDLRRPRRRRGFFLDPRLETQDQAGEALYRRNPLDRGHLIRRLDPCWGSREEAEQANRDSMYFPNIAPQHKDLNQKIWLDLEEHILGLTDDRNAKVSVFVGCLFDENDPPHKSTGIRVPMGFWKVVASLGSCGRGSRRRASLQAQAFVLRQDHLVRDSDLEIVFGSGLETFQLPVEELERMTGLDFHRLRHADTLRVDDEMREAMVAETVSSGRPYAPVSDLVVPIREVEDVVV